MACAAASFPDQRTALIAKRNIVRTCHQNTITYHCMVCDSYHLRHDEGLNPGWIAIIELVAQGFRQHEIAKTLDRTPKGVEFVLRDMQRRFGALSTPHLIAICISIGIINPNKFVPAVTERTHE